MVERNTTKLSHLSELKRTGAAGRHPKVNDVSRQRHIDELTEVISYGLDPSLLPLVPSTTLPVSEIISPSRPSNGLQSFTSQQDEFDG